MKNQRMMFSIVFVIILFCGMGEGFAGEYCSKAPWFRYLACYSCRVRCMVAEPEKTFEDCDRQCYLNLGGSGRNSFDKVKSIFKDPEDQNQSEEEEIEQN